MTALSEFNRYGEELERLLLLRTSPIAVKMLEKEEDVPEGAIRPKRDHGYHLAQCQAFAMSRRQKATVAMLKEDNWCFAPLIAYGLVPKPDDPSLEQFTSFPRMEKDRYIGIVSAPLRTVDFEPDLVAIYSNTHQLRSMLLAMKYTERDLLNYHFFPPVCSYIVVPVMSDSQYTVALPDPGDYERALAGEDEIILSVPRDKMEGFISDLKQFEDKIFGYAQATLEMRPDFPRPDFYKRLFKMWGLDVEE